MSCLHALRLSQNASSTDGNACNGVETCRSGVCASGTALNCNDSNPCTSDSCDPAAGCQYHSLEIAYSRFERTVELPVVVGRAGITTDYQAGMLLVHIRTEEERNDE